MSDYIQVQTTAARRDEADKIARGLVERRLAACAQVIGPIKSLYHWKGAIEADEEWLCLVKSRAELFGQIEQAIRELHAYETPEIIAVPIIAGSARYLSWLRTETGGGD